ncbi:MAG: PDC sensor domain-containing protein [Gammaproteobacteria bacterium]|nr:PDC sensor domain-containing protein [Gammaproteobacteria bacterium]
MLELLKEKIAQQRQLLQTQLSAGMHNTCEQLRLIMDDRAALEALLQAELNNMPHCKHLYVLDADAVQLTANITRTGKDMSHYQRNRSERGYMQGIIGITDFKLAEAYISKNKKRPSLTAVQVIRNAAGDRIGFLGADYDIRELPHTELLYKQSSAWQQLRGDPSIRQGLFLQQRAESVIDSQIDNVMALMQALILEHGVFHGKLHFSSSRATLWLYDDPFNYRLLSAEELLNPDICLVYPRRAYPEEATIPAERLPEIFDQLKLLRFADENIYLRSGSLNVCNGLLGLNFSCDGSHYMHYTEFLEKDSSFWFGVL